MSRIHLPSHARKAMMRHAREVAPAECCGGLLGHVPGAHDLRSIVAVVRVINRDPDVNRAFLIEPMDVLRLERTAAARGLVLIGFYHSHPAGPATPSGRDRAAAWPWYSHVIVGGPEAEDLGAWRLRDDRSRFEPEQVS